MSSLTLTRDLSSCLIDIKETIVEFNRLQRRVLKMEALSSGLIR